MENKMIKYNITDKMYDAYSKINECTESTKSAFMGLCTEIDRFFRICYSIDLNEEPKDEEIGIIKQSFPILTDVTFNQYKQIKKTFSIIRNVNAHLYLNIPIHLDNDLESYFTSKANPLYTVSIDGDITIYGAFYFLTFLSNKTTIWPFICDCFKIKYFNINKTNQDYGKITSDIEHYHQSFCSESKPIYNFSSLQGLNKSDYQYINNVFKSGLTNIFFSLEKCILKWSTSKPNVPSMTSLLIDHRIFTGEDKLLTDLIKIRNCWFHGYMIFDVYTYDDKESLFSIDFALNTILELKHALIWGTFLPVKQRIEYLGQMLLNYFILRPVELSYKILDNRVCTEEKFDNRIKNTIDSFNNIKTFDSSLYDLLERVSNKKIIYYIRPSKFTDLLPRSTYGNPIIIHYFHSSTGFQIGTYHTNLVDLYVVEVDLEEQYYNKINGHFLKEYTPVKEETFSKIIKIVYHNLDNSV